MGPADIIPDGASIEPVINGGEPDGNGYVFGQSASFLGGSDSGTVELGNAGEFDPTIHVGRDKRNADGSYTRKRGRRANGATSSPSRNRKGADYTASIESFSRILGYVHLGIAGATQTPELKLTEEEEKALALSTVRVLEEFDIRPDPKVEAIVGLVTTASMIYGPKYYFIRERKRKEKEDK